MLDTPFPPWPSFSIEEAKAVQTTLLSNKVNYWTGDETRNFECEFAKFAGTDYAVALANGTLALDVALKAIGIGPGDDVVVTPRTFIASISTVVTAGARPVFADVNRESQNLSAATIEAALTPATKAIIIVHLAGMPADMDAVMVLAESRGIKVIEDCAQAHGAMYKKRSVGSIGHVAAWSFCQDKIMSTGGEGGMVTTNDKALWSAMWSYKDHGKSHEAVYEKKHAPGFRWVHESFGTNWRMLELQAVIGRIQLQRMPEWHRTRLGHATRIWDACDTIEWLRVPAIADEFVHAAYKCYVFVNPESLPKEWSRDRIVNAILSNGVPCYQGSCSEVYLESAFEGTDYRPAIRLPVARELGETSLMFLVHPTLEAEHIDRTISAIKAVAGEIQKAWQVQLNGNAQTVGTVVQ
ncbi:DegT/DnrJ/EryC1/StrS aminotransferase family protein [bacterium]|nr:DegT/DnrJ/EryC1/StrS aminotransferase family protein [bacterium]